MLYNNGIMWRYEHNNIEPLSKRYLTLSRGDAITCF